MEQGGGLVGTNPAHTDWVIAEWSKTPTHVLQGLCRMVPGVDVTPLLSPGEGTDINLGSSTQPSSPAH